MKLLPIRSDQHSAAGWRLVKDATHCAEEVLAPVVLDEIHEISANFPILFAPQDDGYRCVCLMGIRPKQNAFVHPTGKWLSTYVPSVYRAYPFALAKSNEEPEKALLCIDTDTGMFVEDASSDDEAIPFFQYDGSPSDRLQQVLGFLQARSQSVQRITAAVNALSEASLLTPWEAPSKGDSNESPRRETGLFQISEEAFVRLPAEKLVDLRDTGALALVFAHRFSLHRLKRLTDFANLRAAHEQSGSDVVSELFEQQDDTLKFDF